MIKKRYLKSLTKFEAKNRAKLGDKAFLEKYIKSYTKSIPSMKILLPIITIVFAINAITNAVLFAQNFFSAFYLLLMICWSISTACGIINMVLYYAVYFGVQQQKIDEWTKELLDINKLESDNYLPNN